MNPQWGLPSPGVRFRSELGTASRIEAGAPNLIFAPPSRNWTARHLIFAVYCHLRWYRMLGIMGHFDNKIIQSPIRFIFMAFPQRPARPRRKPKAKVKTVRKDPLYVDGERPRPMFVDYKNVELLKKLINRHGKIVSRRKTGCSAVSQHAVSSAIKRARFMALLPYVGE